MTGQMECENCHKMFDADKLDMHFSYCRRNIKKCQTCKNYYDINYQEEHDEQFHSKASCQHCGSSETDQDALKRHYNVCKKKPCTCPYCDLHVPAEKFEQHKVTCGSRTDKCPVCDKDIPLKILETHVAECTGIFQPPARQPVEARNYNDHIQRMQARLVQNSIPVHAQQPVYSRPAQLVTGIRGTMPDRVTTDNRMQKPRNQVRVTDIRGMQIQARHNPFLKEPQQALQIPKESYPVSRNEVKKPTTLNANQYRQPISQPIATTLQQPTQQIQGIRIAERQVTISQTPIDEATRHRAYPQVRSTVSRPINSQQSTQINPQQSTMIQRGPQVQRGIQRQVDDRVRSENPVRTPSTQTGATYLGTRSRAEEPGRITTQKVETVTRNGNVRPEYVTRAQSIVQSVVSQPNRIFKESTQKVYDNQGRIVENRHITVQQQVNVRHGVERPRVIEYESYQVPVFAEQYNQQYQEPALAEDEELQRAIAESLRISAKPGSSSFLDLSPDMMNQSFIAKQQAIEEDLRTKAGSRR